MIDLNRYKDFVKAVTSTESNATTHLTRKLEELDNKVKAQDLFIKDLVARIEKLENK